MKGLLRQNPLRPEARNGTVSLQNSPGAVLNQSPENDVSPCNQVVLSGVLAEKSAQRYTPAGVPVVEARLEHESSRAEAGVLRQVRCEIALLALADQARWLQQAMPGMALRVTGFLAARSRSSRQLVLHVDSIEFIEGMKNGSILQEEGRQEAR